MARLLPLPRAALLPTVHALCLRYPRGIETSPVGIERLWSYVVAMEDCRKLCALPPAGFWSEVQVCVRVSDDVHADQTCLGQETTVAVLGVPADSSIGNNWLVSQRGVINDRPCLQPDMR